MTAIGYAKRLKSNEIYNLLSGIPTEVINAETIATLRQENESLTIRSHQQEERIYNLESENTRLKDYLFALRVEPHQMDFFDFSDYRVKSVIGEGATSSVKLVVKNEEFAMKELKNSDHRSVQRFLTEGEVMFILRHPCVLDIVAVNYGDDNHPPSLILNLEPSSLESAIASEALEDVQKCRITVEIVLGMRYIHSRNYMHRDLKTDTSASATSALQRKKASKYHKQKESELSDSWHQNFSLRTKETTARTTQTRSTFTHSASLLSTS